MKKLTCIITFLIAFSATGCRTFTSPARSHDLGNGVTWLDYDATRRGTLLLPPDDAKRKLVLSEPSPDAALGIVSEFVAKGSFKGISAEASAKVTESISELGKRTQTIMFLREALFRLDELQANRREFNKQEIKELYTQVLDAALEIARTDSNKAAAEKAANTSKLATELIQNLGKEPAADILKKMDLK